MLKPAGRMLRVMLGGLWVVANLSFASSYEITGEAYLTDDIETLFYREHYTPISDEGRVEVHYVSSDGERIAIKELYFHRGATKPGYTLKDTRHHLLWSVEWKGNKQLLMRKGFQNAPERKVIKEQPPQVIDAGFDNFVKQEWDRLMDGESIAFYFAFPQRLTNVRLRIDRIKPQRSPIEYREEGWVHFKIRVNNRLLSLFVDSLYLAYEPQERQLKVFRGRSNLPDHRGGGVDVEVRYTHQ